MEQVEWSTLDEAQRAAVLSRPATRADDGLRAGVAAIIAAVRAGGWAGLVEQSLRIDGVEPIEVAVAPAAAAAGEQLPLAAIAAIELAWRNILAFHRASLPHDVAVETFAGLQVRKLWRAIDRVGLYIPGGSSPLFSSLLMLAVPARVAGVGEIVAITPPRAGGGLDPAIAVAAQLCGLKTIWTVGGAQAIAALALGAGEIPAVAKICGPGNAWVAEAKRQVSVLPGGPAIDLPAGPSELMVIADESADPRLVAADLLGQAEHDRAAQVLLVTVTAAFAEAVVAQVASQLASLPRAAVAGAALANGRAIIASSTDEAIAIANRYAPEHLSLALADAEARVGSVRNAGAVFVGGGAAESFGDYLAGSSHVLPTDGAARAHGGISCHSFMKAMSVQTMSADAAAALAAPTATLARLEGLEAHARAAELRAVAA